MTAALRSPAPSDPDAPENRPTPAELAQLVQRLERHFQAVLDGPMKGLPLVHPWLRVQAVGFRWASDAAPAPETTQAPTPWVAEGLLITPWCMNLVRLHATAPPGATPGAKRTHAFGTERFDFIGAAVEGCGWMETCSLFSPMADFADHAQALATAEAVLAELRPAPAASPAASAHPAAPAPAPAPAPASRPGTGTAPVNTARRRWLLGGRATGGAA